MSVHEIDTVDYIYLEEEDHAPVLVVSDPLSWNPAEEGRHIDLLTDKLCTQMQFVSSGQILRVWPDFRDGVLVWVEVAAHCALSERARDFYDQASEALSEANMGLRVMLLS